MAKSPRPNAGEIMGDGEVAAYLQRKGHLILERNYRGPGIIIAFITLKEGSVVFCDVRRTIGPNTFRDDASRLKDIHTVAGLYLFHRETLKSKKYQVDQIKVVLDRKGRVEKIDHSENL